MKLSSLHALSLALVLVQPWACVRGEEPVAASGPAERPSPPLAVERRETVREEREVRREPGSGVEAGRRREGENARRERREELERVRRRLREASEAGREREAAELDREVARLERELEGMRRPQEAGGNGMASGPDMERRRRMEHLQEAVRHLREGGFPDLAVRLEQMGRDVAKGPGSGPGPGAGGGERAGGRPGLRRGPGGGAGEDVETLRGEVRALRRQVERLTRRMEEMGAARPGNPGRP